MRIGNYGVLRELGRTASVVDYDARHVMLPRRATVKVALRAGSLAQEAHLLEALRHPGVPRVFESGTLDDGLPWIAIEPIEGVTLAERPGPLPVDEALRIIRDLASIVSYAHARGVVHRGLAPHRIALCDRGYVTACITDWSTAWLRDRPGGGEPDAAIDEAADVVALGGIARLISTGEARPELIDLIDRMLAPIPADRPTAAEAHADLDWLASVAAAAPPPVLRIRHPRWTPSISAVEATRSDDDPSRTPDETPP